MKRVLLALIAALAVLGLGAAPDADARPRKPRQPSRSKLLKVLADAEKDIYYLSRDGVSDMSVTFKKYTKLDGGSWIKRLMYWKAPDRLVYRIEDLPAEYQPRWRAFVGQLVAEFDGVMYPLVARPWKEYAEEFDLSVPDPADLRSIVFVPKADTNVRFLKKVLDIGESGLPVRVTTIWPPAPPTKEELAIDPDFKGMPIETYTDIAYARVGRTVFFRRIDIEGRERKVIIDTEKWIRRGKHWVPEELTLVDPFAGNEMLAATDILLDQGLGDEMFEGATHRLDR